MSAATEFAELQKLQPKEAVALLQARGKLTTTYAWQHIAGNSGEGSEGVDALLDKWGIDTGK